MTDPCRAARSQTLLHPQQAFDHPVTSMIPSAIVKYKSGFEDPPVPQQEGTDKRNESVTLIIPPRTGEEIPKISVAARILRMLSKAMERSTQQLPPQ